MGQAPDKGLYMPETIPFFSEEQIRSLKGQSYPVVAEFVLSAYLDKDLPAGHLRVLCEDAYAYPVPLEKVIGNRHVMRLDQGPTASFKDFAARMMARLFGEIRKGAAHELVILTATSGDTGSAVANAFYRIPHIQVIVLFPEKEVSDRQRKQMTTLGENITVLSVDGKFDDCQAMVKRAFADPELTDINLTSANSINIGRLLPQSVYYVYAYAQLAKSFEPITFCIPSGNFGNMMGAVLAKRMGIPIKKLVIATNENDEVPVYFRTQKYDRIEPSRECISNAMNVGHPSNFARLLDLYGGKMDETGHISAEPDIESLRQDIWSVSISDAETRRTIQTAWQDHNLLLEPHGAVGWAALNRFVNDVGEDGLMVSVETAHPAKFPEEIEVLLGFSPELPQSLIGLDDKPEFMIGLSNDYGRFRDLLLERAG